MRFRHAWLFLALLLPGPAQAAGSVKAEIKGGSLVVRGDDEANLIEVNVFGLPAQSIRVESPGGITTVNGGGGPVILTGFTKDVKVDLRKGANQFTIEGVPIPGAFSYSGDGGGVVMIDDVVVQKNMQVKSGSSGATDTIDSTDAVVNGRTQIDLRGNGSVIELNKLQALGGLSIKTRGGFDDVDLHDVEGGGSVSIKLGSGGSDVLLFDVEFPKDLKFAAGDGMDIFEIDLVNLSDGRVQANLGKGDADVTLARSTVAKGFRVLAKTGTHTIATNEADTDAKLQIKTAGNTDLDYIDSVCGQAQIKLGNGDDLVSIDDSVVKENLKLLTGNGLNQTSFEDGAGVLGKALIKGGKQGDLVLFQDSQFQDDVKVLLGPGFGSFSVQPSAPVAVWGDLRVIAKGSDQVGVDIDLLTVLGDVLLQTGNGDDDLFLDDFGFESDVVIRTGGGDDELDIERAATGVGPALIEDDLRIDTGAGDDLLLVGQPANANGALLVGDAATMDGGSGDQDSIGEAGLGNMYGEGLTLKNFELEI